MRHLRFALLLIGSVVASACGAGPTLDSQDAPLKRLSAFLAKAQTLSVRFTVASPQYQGQGKGLLRWRRPREQAFEVDWSPGRAAYVQNDREEVEFNRTAKSYLSYPAPRALAAPPSIASGLTGLAYPTVLVVGGVTKAMPPGTTFTKGPSETIEGMAVDVVDAKYQGQVTIEAQAAIDASGRLLRYRVKTSGQSGAEEVTWEFTDWQLGTQFKSGDFAAHIEDGYTPYALPAQIDPIEVGSDAPQNVTTKGAKGKWRLLAFLGEDGASAALRTDWPRFVKALAPRKADSVFVSVRKQAGAMWIADPEGKLAASWRAPGTPFIALVNPSGKVAWLAFGYLHERQKETLDALVGALQGSQ